jgi:hypothetical protein
VCRTLPTTAVALMTKIVLDICDRKMKSRFSLRITLSELVLWTHGIGRSDAPHKHERHARCYILTGYTRVGNVWVSLGT